ncbi:MAG: hypothetical protein KC583_20750 [Myxococcales bacterium]|nr:hypothetical protein [Myxococcales bacterium]MCA9560996.1 hypothetical protein [Myxococcales bacterium]MCB9523807.1 hypothetical protein [Myxococcales bacterium]
MRAPAALIIALTTLFAATGCGGGEVKPDSASGDDFERAGAAELFLDKLTDDYVDADKGDNTDWKFFKIRQRGILELTIYWDQKDVRSIVDVRDRFGVLIDSRRHSAELEKDKMDLKVEPGTHFVRLFTDKGKSVYTIEARFQPFDYKATDDAIPEAMEDDPLAELGDSRPMERAPVRRRRAPTVSRRPAASAGATTAARITRVVNGPRGGSILYLNAGEAQGLKVGQTGFIEGLGPTEGGFRIVKVGQKFATAQTTAKPSTIAHRRSVKVNQ